MTLSVTPLYAGLIALIFILLSTRVILYRRKHLVSVGDAGDKKLLKRMRAQANCAEYAPIGLLLLLLAELQGAPLLVLHALGLMLLAGRFMHGYGFSQSPGIMPLRVGGMALTLIMIIVTALGLVAHALF